MIIRPLRPDENAKRSSVTSIAFSTSVDLEEIAGQELTDEVIGAFLDDNETLAAVIRPIQYYSNYCGHFLPASGIAGVASLPEYRRSGCVREIFNEIFRISPERGWATSFLNPFSYDYYRKFGYERVLQKMSIRIPVVSFNAFERNCDAKLYNGGEMINDILEIYSKFALNHNMMFMRDAESKYYSAQPHKSKSLTYVWYNGVSPSAYATVTVDSRVLNIKELIFNDNIGLAGLLGFLRMFEGQVHEYFFSSLPVGSELELMLKQYSGCDYRIHSATMGRVVLVEKLLNLNTYPEHYGRFRLRVDDPLEYNRGVYQVEYSDGKAEVKKVAGLSDFDTADYDVSMEIPPLSRIMLGCDDFDADKASYLSGVKLNNNANDFFRAFPKRKGFLYDRF